MVKKKNGAVTFIASYLTSGITDTYAAGFNSLMSCV